MDIITLTFIKDRIAPQLISSQENNSNRLVCKIVSKAKGE
jgi:hypothetical protein